MFLSLLAENSTSVIHGRRGFAAYSLRFMPGEAHTGFIPLIYGMNTVDLCDLHSNLAYFSVSACPYKKLTLRIVYAIIISAILSATLYI